jgi:hypothetical protein
MLVTLSALAQSAFADNQVLYKCAASNGDGYVIIKENDGHIWLWHRNGATGALGHLFTNCNGEFLSTSDGHRFDNSCTGQAPYGRPMAEIQNGQGTIYLWKFYSEASNIPPAVQVTCFSGNQ